MFTPLNSKVLIEPDQKGEEETTQSGIVMPSKNEERDTKTGVVLGVAEDVEEIEVGERVLYLTYAADELEEQKVVVPFEDILGVWN